MMDKIVEGRRRKILGIKCDKKTQNREVDEETRKALDGIEIDRDALFKEEFAKAEAQMSKADPLVQIPTGE